MDHIANKIPSYYYGHIITQASQGHTIHNDNKLKLFLQASV